MVMTICVALDSGNDKNTTYLSKEYIFKGEKNI
jgi:hypothetical protein